MALEAGPDPLTVTEGLQASVALPANSRRASHGTSFSGTGALKAVPELAPKLSCPPLGGPAGTWACAGMAVCRRGLDPSQLILSGIVQSLTETVAPGHLVPGCISRWVLCRQRQVGDPV